MPQVSVIVPLYNKAQYVERCLGAIRGQSLSDLEVIVVNDGSTDGSEKIVARVADHRVKLVSQDNAGPGAARNHGVRLAQSPIVAFLDGDDAWHPDYLRESVAWMERSSPEVASVTWGMMIFPMRRTTEQSWSKLTFPQGVFRADPRTPPKLIVAMLANMLPSSTVMRKAIFEELGGYYAKYRCLYSEDAYLYLKMLLRYAAVFDSRPLTLRHEDASELALNLKGARPIEPFLLDPDDLERDAPEPMRPLLREVLALRALKTASVYGYWGDSRRSRQLMTRFVSAHHWRKPYFATAIAGCTPLGGWAGRLARTLGARGAKS